MQLSTKHLTYLLLTTLLLLGLKLSYSQNSTPFVKYIDSLANTKQLKGKSIDSSIYYANSINEKLHLKNSELTISKGHKNKSEASYYYELDLKEKELQTAVTYFNKIFPNAKDEIFLKVLKNYIDAYKKKGDVVAALKYSEIYIKTKDSISKIINSKKVTEITKNYNSEKNQQQIDKLNVDKQLREAQINNQYYLFIVLISLLIILATSFCYRFRSQKNQQELNSQNLKHKLLQIQLNPHFIFHSLNAIQSYIFMNKKEEATTYLASYSKLMRSILESSDAEFITVNEDYNSIKAFLKLQQLNAAEDVLLETTIEEHLGDYKIPPMFTQPFVENAIMHGINDIKKGKVHVSYSHNENHILVTISDNGSGFKKNNSNTKMHRSMSSKILNERIALFKARHQYAIKTNIESNTNGTNATICFPKIK